jgi:hypothetical protein
MGHAGPPTLPRSFVKEPLLPMVVRTFEEIAKLESKVEETPPIRTFQSLERFNTLIEDPEQLRVNRQRLSEAPEGTG